MARYDIDARHTSRTNVERWAHEQRAIYLGELIADAILWISKKVRGLFGRI